MMKANKAKVQKKAAKKVVKKELEKSLAEKFLEVVKNLGHDAEHIAGDISKASKTLAKKLSRNITAAKEVIVTKIETKPLQKLEKKATSPIVNHPLAATALKNKTVAAVKSTPSAIIKKAKVKTVKTKVVNADDSIGHSKTATSRGKLIKTKPVAEKTVVSKVPKATPAKRS
jgi:Txe/YoeB family toxin of Txe-Axe toxin-antitoxin module